MNAYDQVIGQLARQADALDDYWRRFKSILLQGPVARRLRPRVVRAVRLRVRCVAPSSRAAPTRLPTRQQQANAMRDRRRRGGRSRTTGGCLPRRPPRHPEAVPARLRRPGIRRTARGSGWPHASGISLETVRIGIDARKLHDFGIGTYIRNLLRQLARIDHDTEYVIFSRPERSGGAGIARRELPDGCRDRGQVFGGRTDQDSAGDQARRRDAVSRAALRAAAARRCASRSSRFTTAST